MALVADVLRPLYLSLKFGLFLLFEFFPEGGYAKSENRSFAN